jgi:ribosomal-protein-alanine N-acetyltransferase
MTHELRPPTGEELREVAVLAARADLFGSSEEVSDLVRREPWRVQVSDAGDAVILEQWRDHLDWLSMRAVWAAPRRVPALVEGVRGLARDRGLTTVLSPIVAADLAGPYRKAGMDPTLRILMLRRSLCALDAEAGGPGPAGVDIGEGGPDEIEELLALDADCFDPVWAWDRTLLARYVSQDRLITARAAGTGRLLGYATAGRADTDGTIGRLAVAPADRRHGVGGALLIETLRGLAWAGASCATLTTQVDNVAAQRLYLRSGFRVLRGELLGLTIRA